MTTSATPAGTADRPDSSRSGLVDMTWLADHLHDPDVRVVEVDVNAAAYEAGHIEGAVLWDIYTDLKDPDYRLVDRSRVQALVERSGIDEHTTVVFYGYGPAMGFWLLRLHGHERVRLLDAHRDTWRDEHRPWTTEAPTPIPTRYPLAEADAHVRASQAEVAAAIGDPTSTILDVRSPEEYRGERFWPSGGLDPDGRAGHIPGATHLVAADPRDERGAFRSSAALAREYAALDLSADHEIISYCTIGARAATAWFVLTHLLGHDRTRVYDGSWAEWGRTPTVPVDTDAAQPSGTTASVV